MYLSVCLQTVEERRTVRDGQGNEETTVIRSGGPGDPEGPHDDPVPPTPGQLTRPDALTLHSKVSELQCSQ